jgi:hypothetical protein
MEILQKYSVELKSKLHMKSFLYMKGILFIFFILLSASAAAPNYKVAYIEVSEPIYAYNRLINAVVQVESAGDTLAYNLIEKARGAFQIRPIRVRDYNQRTGSNYKPEDCFNYEISKEIFLYYAKKTGYPNYQLIARNWNGSGRRTLDYWKKVKIYL